jgi:melatonin receptor type 1A
MGILSEHLQLATLIMSRWPFSEAVCQYQGIVAITMATASAHTLAWTALNRYFKIVKTKYYSKVFARRKLVAILAFIWISSVLANSPYLLAGYKFVFHPAKFFCYMSLDVTWFTAFFVTIYLGIPTAVIVFCYLKVFQTVRKHNTKLSKMKERGAPSVEEIKVTRTLFIIVVVFIGCGTPILIMDLIDTFRGRWSLPRSAYTSYTFLATLSFAVNPFIYAFTNPAFKEEYFKVLQISWQSLKVMCCCVRGRHDSGTRTIAIEKPKPAGCSSIHIQRVMEKRNICCSEGDIPSVAPKPASNCQRNSESFISANNIC